MITLYGIPNCDTVKKARTWLEEHGVAYSFHDYKKEGITKARLTQWSKQVGWETLLNKKSTTWRGLEELVKESVTGQAAAVKVMAENTSLIKRPVITEGETVVLVGFDAAGYAKAFQ